jgi:hypothetical protein
MDPRKQAIRGLLDEFLTAIKQSDKTPIVPAPNRWFAKPEDFPHQQAMIERALAASGKTRDDFLHGAYLDPRTGQDLTGRMMSDVGAVIDPNTGRPVMSGRESNLESFAELEKRLGNQTLSNLVRRSKFKPLGGDPLLNDIPFITTVESGPHFYGLGMEYASPTQLFQIQRGDNPHLRPKSRGDVFGMGEVVGRMQIGKGPEHDVYEKLFVAPRGSDVPGKKLNKAEGGEVQMGSNKKMPNDESAFQNWIRGTDWFKEFKAEYNEEPDLDTKDYDYRAAWKAGVQPERDPYDNNRFHWPSSLSTGEMLKSADHPTAWKEYFMRETGVNPDALGLKTPEDANIFIENISKGQEKAAGGEVHMDKGGDPMLADLIERYNTPRNKSRYSAGIFDSNAPGEVRSVTPTVKERMASGLQSAMEAAGSDRSKARQRAQTILGGPSSRLPGGFGVVDVGAMLNPTIAAGMIPVYAESAMHDLAGVPDALKRGDYVGAGVDTAFGLMDLIPAVGQGKRVAKGVAKSIKDAVTSDAGYDLAQRVLNATGTAPMQIMIGPKAKTYRHADAALAAQMEKEGKSRDEIWQATRTVRAPDNELKQELSDLNMRYSASPVRSRQYETDRKRYSQAIDKATTQDELQAAQKYYEKQRGKNSLNFIGKAQEFIEHPELFQAYPELANYAFRELEPTHKKFTAPQNVYGFYSPGQQSITVNTDAPLKRSTALHELQHAIQEIEGWQGGSSPQEMAARLADREIAKAREQDLQQIIKGMGMFSSSGGNSIETEKLKLKNIQDFLNKTKQLEGETDPYDAYRKVSGEEEARMVQARQPYPEEKLAERPPFMDYEADPSLHITDFATGGAVMMAGGKDVTKEAIKQGVKKGVDAIGEFLNSIQSAGRAAHKEQAPSRAAKDAEIEDIMAALPPRSKSANEAAGLYHPVGGGIKLTKPVSGMHATTVADPKFKPPKINIITPEQLVKEEAALMPLVGDRAAGGRYLTHIGENELERPVRLTAGPLYMDANYNHIDPEQSAVWESGLGRVTALGNTAARAGAGGRPVYGVYTAGSGTNTDFNVMGANALLQQMPFSNITPDAAQAFDQAMREGSKEFPPIPNWPGIQSPEAMDLVLDKSNGILRTKLFGTMGKQNFQSMGFPDVAATRKAIIEPELLDVPTNQAGFRLARMDPTGRIIENPNIPSDYPAAMAGKVAGKLDVPADYKDIWQSHFDARRLFSQPESGDYYSFSRAHPFQIADDEWLNRLMEKRLADELRIKEGEYAEGGEAHMDKGGSVKNAVKDVIEGLRSYVDPIATKISEWNWRPMTDVRQDVPDTEVPEYIQKGYGDFMAEQAKRAAAGDLNARDLIKAYTITRSSVNRGGLPYNTATKTGMQLPRTQGLVRPEGAFAEWLGSKAGQRYLDQAVKGTFTESDLDDMVTRFAPFGMPAVLADDMRYAARSLSPKGATISSDVMASPEVYREVSQQLKGIGPAKSGFMASLLGRGDYPTFDARQIRLHTGQGGKDAAKYMTRGKGVGGEEAVARLADRQRAMDMSLDPSLDPFYQHLVHHTVWDKLGNEQTTHDDLVKAMRGYADGGEVDSDGVTLDEFLSKQGY